MTEQKDTLNLTEDWVVDFKSRDSRIKFLNNLEKENNELALIFYRAEFDMKMKGR